MRVFEILLNDRKVCTAGVGENGVLTAMVTWRVFSVGDRKGRRKAKEDLTLSVGGLALSPAEDLQWQYKRLRQGDEIHIRIAEANRASKPSRREPHDPRLAAREEKKYVEKAAKRLGWKIVKPKSTK